MVGAKCDCDCGSVRRSDDVFGNRAGEPNLGTLAAGGEPGRRALRRGMEPGGGDSSAFNLACAKDTRASYGIVDSTNVSVKNTCTTWTGQANEIVGNARVTDPATGAQLHVSFPGVPSQESLDGPPNYIVTYIADDYSWALVGDPLRLSGFVLSRSAVIDAAGWSEIRRVAESRGYNACTILTSPTTEARRTSVRSARCESAVSVNLPEPHSTTITDRYVWFRKVVWWRRSRFP